MFLYLITFVGGFERVYRANTPKEAWLMAEKQFGAESHMVLEPASIKYVGGK